VTDSELESPGISLDEVVKLANKSPALSRIIILDSCHSGAAGDNSNRSGATEIVNGVTILTACTKDQYSMEDNGAGLFTSLLVNALGGAGANLVGEVTPASVYAHIDQSLPPGMQRPVFKTNVTEFISLRRVEPAVPIDDLHRITEFFPSRPYIYKLDPAHEPERTGKEPPDFPKPDPDKTTRFAILQKFNRNGLVVPVDAPHMWHAAIGSRSCKLTPLGEHYRSLVEKKLV
jgi:Caspase domain